MPGNCLPIEGVFFGILDISSFSTANIISPVRDRGCGLNNSRIIHIGIRLSGLVFDCDGKAEAAIAWLIRRDLVSNRF